MSTVTTEKYICDRCGAEFEYPPRVLGDLVKYAFECDRQVIEESVTRDGFIADYYLDRLSSKPKTVAIEVIHRRVRKSYDLCPNCEKEFKNFLKNKL